MADDTGGLGGLLGWFGRPYDPQAAYEGLLSNQATQDALRARSLASVAQAFGAGAGSDARGSAIPFGATMGNAAAAAYSGQDALIAARNVAAEQMLHQAQASKASAEAAGLPAQFKMYDAFFKKMQEEGNKPSPLSPAGLLASQKGAGGGGSVDADPNVSNNNFGGLREPGVPAAGGPRENPKGWQTFPTPEAGVAAIDSQIQRYASGATTGKPINTLAGIITTWAPPTDNNDTAGLIARASKITGFKPDQPLDMSDPATRAKVTEALIRGEHGDQLPSAVTPEVMAKAHGLPAPHVFAPPVAAATDTPVTPTEADIYRKAPFPTLQNAGVVPPPVMTDKLPTGTIAPNPFDTPTGGSLAPAAPPAAPLAPQGAVGGEKLSGLLGAQPDPVTAQTVAAIRGAGPTAPGVSAAAPSPVASLLAPGAAASGPAAPPGGDIRAALGAAGAAPQVPPQLQSLLAQAGGGAPPIPQGGVPQGPPPVVSGAVGMEKGGGLLNPPPAPPPAVPPAAAPVPLPAAAPGAPAMPPGGIPLPALPPMPTLPAPPQLGNVPVPPMPAPTTLEGMAQAISGISSLTGHPAPAFMQDLAKMPAARQQELYKAYLLNETNAMNEKYKAQIQLTTTQYVEAAKANGALPAQITQELLKQQLWLNPQTNRYEMLPGAVEKLALEEKTKQDAIAAREKEVATYQSGLRTGEKGQELLLTQLIDKRHPEALDAVRSLQSSAEARQLLDQKVITGFGAPAKLQFGKALQALGFHYNDDPIANTEAFLSARGGETARALKPFGTGSGVSDADRIYARQMVGGDIAFNEQSLRKLLDISDKAHHTTIDNFNHDLDRQAPKLVPALRVEKPEAPSTAHPPGGYDFDPKTRTMKPRVNPQ